MQLFSFFFHSVFSCLPLFLVKSFSCLGFSLIFFQHILRLILLQQDSPKGICNLDNRAAKILWWGSVNASRCLRDLHCRGIWQQTPAADVFSLPTLQCAFESSRKSYGRRCNEKWGMFCILAPQLLAAGTFRDFQNRFGPQFRRSLCSTRLV